MFQPLIKLNSLNKSGSLQVVHDQQFLRMRLWAVQQILYKSCLLFMAQVKLQQTVNCLCWKNIWEISLEFEKLTLPKHSTLLQTLYKSYLLLHDLGGAVADGLGWKTIFRKFAKLFQRHCILVICSSAAEGQLSWQEKVLRKLVCTEICINKTMQYPVRFIQVLPCLCETTASDGRNGY